MPFVNQGHDGDIRGSWHHNSMINMFRERPFKSHTIGTQPFATSVLFHESPNSKPHPSFSHFYGAHYDSKSGLPDSSNPFRNSHLRGFRSRNLSERPLIEPAANRSRLGSLRLDYGDIGDVFCPSYVDRDAAKMRNQQPVELLQSAGALEKDFEKNETKSVSQKESPTDSNEEVGCLDVGAAKSCTYSTLVDAEAERALLISMGWHETDDEDFHGDISEEEIQDFYRLLRNSQSSPHLGRFVEASHKHFPSGKTSSSSATDQQEVFDSKCLSEDLSSDDSLSVDEDD